MQLRLLDLAHRVARQHLDVLDLLGALVARKAQRLAVRAHLGERERCTVAGDHDGAHTFARAADRADRSPWPRAPRGCRDEHVLDLGHRDVLRVADHDLLKPPGDPHVARDADAAEVAGAEPPPGEVTRRVERGVRVADAAAGVRGARARPRRPPGRRRRARRPRAARRRWRAGRRSRRARRAGPRSGRTWRWGTR